MLYWYHLGARHAPGSRLGLVTSREAFSLQVNTSDYNTFTLKMQIYVPALLTLFPNYPKLMATWQPGPDKV